MGEIAESQSAMRDVAEIQAQGLGRDLDQDGLAALTDLGRGDEQGGALAVLEHPDDRVGVRELAAVDRVAGAGHEAAAADADPLAEGQLAPLGVPARLLAHVVQRRLELAAQHVEVVDRAGVGVHGVGQAEVDGVHADPLGQHVEQALEGEARLRHAVAAHGAAGRLVGVHPPAASSGSWGCGTGSGS